MNTILAYQRLSDEQHAAILHVLGGSPGAPRTESSRLFAEAVLAALNAAAASPRGSSVRALIPNDLEPLLKVSNGRFDVSPEIGPLSADAANWFLRLSVGNVDTPFPSAGGLPTNSDEPLAVGKIIRVSVTSFTRYSLVETPLGDPILVSIARGGVLVKQSRLGLFGPVLFRGDVRSSAVMTEKLHRIYGSIRLPLTIHDPVLRVWTQTSLSVKDGREMVEVCL
jgi:hypothetical protein